MISETEDYLGHMPDLPEIPGGDVEGDQSGEKSEAEQKLERDVDNKAERSPRVEDLPDEEHHKAVQEGLRAFKGLLRNIDDYTVFASTAMYLNGMRLAQRGVELGEEVQRPPGDIDIAVSQRSALMLLAERVRSVPGAEVGNDGRPERLQGEDAFRLKGTIPVNYESDGEQKTARYEFEIFYRSNIVTPDVTRGNVINVGGFRVLNLEGLRRQYERSLRIEGSIDQQAEEISEFLASGDAKAETFLEEVRAGKEKSELSEISLHILNKFDVSVGDIQAMLKVQEDINEIEKQMKEQKGKRGLLKSVIEKFKKAGVPEQVEEQSGQLNVLDQRAQKNSKVLQKLIGSRSKILSNRKTKSARRLESIHAAMNPEQQAADTDQNAKSESMPDQNNKAA